MQSDCAPVGCNQYGSAYDRFSSPTLSGSHSSGDSARKARSASGNCNLHYHCRIRQRRAEEILCRYGGEEFTIILPDTKVKGACDRAESILTVISHLQVSSGRDSFDGFSISIGIAFFPGDGDTAEELLQHADAALYDANTTAAIRSVSTSALSPRNDASQPCGRQLVTAITPRRASLQ